MAEGDQVDISEEVNPPVPVHSQPPPTHTSPPPTPAGVLPAYSGAPSTHLHPQRLQGRPFHKHHGHRPPPTIKPASRPLRARAEPCLLELHASTGARADSRPSTRDSTDPSPGEHGCARPANAACVHGSTFHQPISATIGPHSRPSSTCGIPHFRSGLIRAAACCHASPGCGLYSPSADGFPDLKSTFSDSLPNHGVSTLLIATTPYRPLLPGATPHKHYFPRTGHADSCGPFIPEHAAAPEVQNPGVQGLRGHNGSTPSSPPLPGKDATVLGDIPTWEDLSRKFIDQYRYCAEAPPTLLELSTKEMARGQRFEEYAAKWRAQAAKHIPPISEAQQHQPQSIYYSTSPVPSTMTSQSHYPYAPASAQSPQPRPSVSRAPPPAQESPTSQGPQIQPISPGPNFDLPVQDQSKRCEYHQGTPGHTLDNCWRLRDEIQRRIDNNRLTFNAVGTQMCRPTPSRTIGRENPLPFVINYTPEELTVGFTGHVASPTPFVVDIPARESYSDSKVPWTYKGSVGSVEQQFSVMGVTRSGRVYESSATKDKGKAPAVETGAAPESLPFPSKKVTEEEAEAFMKIVKASEYKAVEQMAKSPTHISLLALLLGSESHQEALFRVLTTAQAPKETPSDRIEETIGSIFSNTISFSDDKLPSEGWSHSRALHIVCKCNNYIGRVMIDNGSTLNVCPVTTLKQKNVDINRVRPSKTAVRAFDGSRRECPGPRSEILVWEAGGPKWGADNVGPCSFSITFQVLDIPNAFGLLLERPWIHSAGAVPSSLHQRLKFIVEEKLITVRGEEDYAIYKETAVPYISVLLRNNYIPGTGLGARGQGINCPIEVEGYKHRTGLGFRPSCPEIIEVRRGNHLHHLTAYYRRLNRGTSVPLLSRFFPGPSHTIGGTLDDPSSDSDDTPATPSAVLHSNPNLQCFDSDPSREQLGEPQPVYFGEGLPEDNQAPEIKESLRRLEDHQITPVEPTEEIYVGIEKEPRTLKIETALDPTQRARMIDFLKEYQEVFAWSYADMPGLDPSIVEHFLLLDTEKCPPKRQQLRR
ncbi:hypothetical protein CRG98_019225 [Punica granatum]|uniref:G-patch domain-containing protein n=1 Tax=Punica granatum TaxID=22663 RepID=A0A2I0JY47_PUNGR|nr:hypothetical protein CRG98_019225 [Punica granatum]